MLLVPDAFSPGESSTYKNRVLSRVIFYHGTALDGIEFFYDDESSQLFGKRGGKPGGDTFEMGKGYSIGNVSEQLG